MLQTQLIIDPFHFHKIELPPLEFMPVIDVHGINYEVVVPVMLIGMCNHDNLETFPGLHPASQFKTNPVDFLGCTLTRSKVLGVCL